MLSQNLVLFALCMKQRPLTERATLACPEVQNISDIQDYFFSLSLLLKTLTLVDLTLRRTEFSMVQQQVKCLVWAFRVFYYYYYYYCTHLTLDFRVIEKKLFMYDPVACPSVTGIHLKPIDYRILFSQSFLIIRYIQYTTMFVQCLTIF